MKTKRKTPRLANSEDIYHGQQMVFEVDADPIHKFRMDLDDLMEHVGKLLQDVKLLVDAARPHPRLPGKNKADGVRYLTPAQCAKQFGRTEEAWRDEWISIWGSYLNADSFNGLTLLFEIDELGKPHARLPRGRKADGVRYFSPTQMALKLGRTPMDWREEWMVVLGSYAEGE